MDSPFSAKNAMAVTDVYTNLQGLQQLAKTVDKDEGLKKVAQQFESMFISMMLKNMRNANAVFEKDSMFNSEEASFYRDMHDHQLSLTLAHKKGLGIADVLYRQMSRSYGNQEAASDLPAMQYQTRYASEAPVYKSAVAERVSIADTPKTFVDKVMPYIKKAANALGVDAEMLTAQAALETGWGKYMLANKNGDASNNLFNIKRNAAWQGDSVNVNSLEEKNGVLTPEKSEFKAYENLDDSVNDYVDLLKGSQHFQEAVNSAGNSYEFIEKLHKAGYATDSAYADKVFSVYQQVKNLGGDE